MKATITKTELRESKHGGTCTLVTFKGDDGKSYLTWISSTCRNSGRWNQIIKSGEGTILDNLLIKKDNLVDADSYPEIVK